MLTLLASCASSGYLLSSKKRILGVTGIALGLSLMQPQMAFAQEEDDVTEYSEPASEAPLVSESFEDAVAEAPDVEAAPVPTTRDASEKKAEKKPEKKAEKKPEKTTEPNPTANKAAPKQVEAAPVEQSLPTETKADSKAQDQAPAAANSPVAETKVEHLSVKGEELSNDTATATEPASEEKSSLTETSDGAPIRLDELGISITPPKSWEVTTNAGGLSVVMKEPRNPNPVYDRAKYQRNITVAAIHTASPIDEKRAAELKDEMTKKFSQDSLVKDFQILEHKFFNYRGTNDGLLLFSSLSIGEYPMMQMHVLVSGQSKQFLMSYTDLADQFQDQSNGTYDQAWQTMTSIEVAGETPQRADQYLRYGAFAAGFLLLGLTGFFVRRKASRFDFSKEADALEEADGDVFSNSDIASHASDAARKVKAAATQKVDYAKAGKAKKRKSDDFDLSGADEQIAVTGAGEWQLASSDADDDFAFSEVPRTKQTEYVASNH